jgi:glycosyltransferase involved in cell wall biosynthesis
MKLMQTMAGGAVGGAEEFFVRLAAGFERIGVEQTIVTRPNDTRGPRLTEAGIQPVELPFGGMFDWRTVPALAAEIDRVQPDIILSWMNRASAMTGKAVRKALTKPGAKPGTKPVVIGRLGGYYDLKYYSGCDHLIGNTPDIVRYLVEGGWPEAQAHFVPNFVSAVPGTALPRSEFEVPDDVPLLLAAGRLHRNKAFDILLQAVKRTPDAYLLLAGDGGDARDLESLAHKLGVAGRVRFLGWRTDMANLMATADMLVCPSRIEPLGNVIIEAWARNIPVVAAAALGPAWLIEDGADGLLAPVDDPELLSDAISRLFTEPGLAPRMVAAGRQKFEADFTESAVVAKFIDLFERVRG